MATNGWIDRPDRTHQNLKLIDKLKRELTYDGHEDDLLEMQQAHFNGNLHKFRRIHRQLSTKEKVHRGDRTHPNLARLDALQERLTYDGWREDLKNAEKEHLRCSSYFEMTVRSIERKQKIHDGDRSDAEVQYLDSLRLSYPGWEEDVQKTMDSYLRGHSFLGDKHQFSFAEKQRMHEGNRSHPRLVALDALRLTYPGWEEDVKAYEERHVSTTLERFEGLRQSSIQIDMFRSKQELYSTGVDDSSWMNPDQRTIVNTQWTFPGWEQEVEKVRVCTFRDFGKKLEHFQVRQMLHDNDYTGHPLLVQLNSIKLSYPGWKKDVADVKTQLAKSWLWKKTFEDNLQGLLNKQHAYGKKEKKKEEEIGLKECVICMSAPLTHVFVPCGHMCACKSCSETLIENSNKCPICNQQATSSMEVFFS